MNGKIAGNRPQQLTDNAYYYIRLVRYAATGQHSADKVFEASASERITFRDGTADRTPKYIRPTKYRVTTIPIDRILYVLAVCVCGLCRGHAVKSYALVP